MEGLTESEIKKIYREIIEAKEWALRSVGKLNKLESELWRFICNSGLSVDGCYSKDWQRDD